MTQMTQSAIPAVDVTTPQFKADPFPFCARLRAEAPVYCTALPDKMPIWIISRYDDVVALLKDERFGKDKRRAMTPPQVRKQPWVPSTFRALERNMLDLDPPDHPRLRALVHKAFTPRLVERMRARAESLSEELLDAAVRRGEMDVIADFALPLPMTIITEILGVPTADRGKFHKWSSDIVSADQLNPSWRMLPTVVSIFRFVGYLRRFFKVRRADPRDDLVSALIQAEEAGDKLSEDELTAMVFLLLVAGHETTVNLIATGTLELLRHPEEMERLRRDPSLAKSAVEELLRFTAPVFLSTERYAREDVTLHGVAIPRGGLVFGAIGSANRDSSAFENPDALDLARANNRHLSFGQGIHYCLGAPLARLEAEIAFNALLRRAPNLRLAVPQESLRWRRSLLLRGLQSLPVRL